MDLEKKNYNCLLFITFQWLKVAKEAKEADTVVETEIPGMDQLMGDRKQSLIVSITYI
jgi:hypothetical protein